MSPHSISFTIPGPPVPKARARTHLVKPTGREPFVSTYTPKKSEKFENLVTHAYWKKREGAPSEEPIAIVVEAFLPIPKSWPKYKQAQAASDRMPVIKRPDLDNLVKSVLDGLNAVAFKDDSQVFYMRCTKHYSHTPRTEVSVYFGKGE
jgi:Holliday junction resolvase RusA-like endonuclease